MADYVLVSRSQSFSLPLLSFFCSNDCYSKVIPPTESNAGRDLRDHLLTCDETRIHAANMFCRYMLRVGDAVPSVNPKETSYIRRARRRIIWDVALSCLALSVKVTFLYNYLDICTLTRLYKL